MRILVAGLEWHGRMADYCAEGFRVYGHEVQVFHTNRVGGMWESLQRQLPYIPRLKSVMTRHWHNASNQRFLARVRGFRPDIIFAVVTNGWCLTRETLLAAREFCPRIISDLSDDPFRFPVIVDGLSAYTFHFTGYPAARDLLPQVTAVPVLFLPGAGMPSLYHPVPPAESEAWRCEVGFVGAAYHTDGGGAMRGAALEAVAGRRLLAFGDPGWRHLIARYPALRRKITQRILCAEEANLLYNGATVILNPIHPQLRYGFTNKVFEAALAGACQIVSWQEQAGEFFEPGREILMYKSLDELRMLVEQCLADERACRKIGERARRRALAEHTYAHRMGVVLKTIG